jgi:ABC-type multidrug transport system fused ATPase/permease subunit
VDSSHSIYSFDWSGSLSFVSAEAKMKLFPINEWELRTRKSKDEVVSNLSKRATFATSEFKSYVLFLFYFIFFFSGLAIVFYIMGKISFFILLISPLFIVITFFSCQLEFDSSVEMQKMSISQLVKGTD